MPDKQLIRNKDEQVGGDHYSKLGIQPWEIITANKLDFFEGSALSYLLRWKDKGGVEDLDKIIDYINQMKHLVNIGWYDGVKSDR